MYCISWFICRRNSKKCNIFRFSIDMNSTVSMQSNIICWQGNVHCWITGKYGLNFEIQNLDLQSIKAQSEKQISMLRNVSLDSLSFLFFGKSEKGFEKKTVYKHSVLADVHTLLAEKRALFYENSFVNPFLHSNQMIKKESSITQSILRTEFSAVKPLFWFSIRLQNPKSGFQNQNLGFDVTSLLLSPSWLIFFLQHRAVRQLKSNTAQQLEVETKKMEERIRALKEQMFKEKEERE